MEIKCKVHEIGTTQQVSETFKRRDLIVEYSENPTYPEYIKLEALQDKCSLLDSIKVGDTVDVSFNLRGRPWTDKAGKTSYFNSLIVWKISTVSAGSGTPEYAPNTPVTSEPEGDLPF